MEMHLKVIGALLMALALLHGIFPRYFHWDRELKSLSLINRQIMQVHTLFIALGVFLMGLLCLFAAPDLVHTPLGHTIALGLGVFWGVRLLVQLVGYSSALWKGKSFETAVHVLFTLFWTYLTAVFFAVAFNF